MICILMTRPGGKHSAGFLNLPVLNGSPRRPLQDPAAHTKTKSNPAGVHCGHLGKECKPCLNFSANCFGLMQKAACLHPCSGKFFKQHSKAILCASSGVSVFRRAAQSVSRGQRLEGAAVCKGRGLLSAQINKTVDIIYSKTFLPACYA